MDGKIKVLILGQPFNRVTGGGITLSNLFGNWDSNCLAVVCSPYLIDGNTDFNATSNYYQLGDAEHKWRFPFNLLKRKYVSGPVELPKDSGPPRIDSQKSKTLRGEIIEKYFYPSLEYLGIMPAVSCVKTSRGLEQWIDAFSPDVIYAQATSRNGVNLIRALQSRYTHIPFIFHMMDDWPSTIRSQNRLGAYWHKVIDTEFKSMINAASVCLSISDFMSEDYLKRYGVRFRTFHNPIDFEFWNKSAKKDYELESNCRILYAGRLGLGVDNTLIQVANAVELLNSKMDINITLNLQTPSVPDWAERYRCVVHNPFVAYKELPTVFGKADMLVLPYDFESKSSAFIKYSMPTKASEYFASGTPVLVIAPEETAIVKYVRLQRCAAVVNKNCVDSVANGIRQLIENKEERASLGNVAKMVAKKFHDAVLVRKHFVETLQSSLK